MVRTRREKDKGRCNDENMEDGSGWTPKDTKTQTEVKRCHTKRYEREKKHKNMENRNSITDPQIGKRARKKNRKPWLWRCY